MFFKSPKDISCEAFGQFFFSLTSCIFTLILSYKGLKQQLFKGILGLENVGATRIVLSFCLPVWHFLLCECIIKFMSHRKPSLNWLKYWGSLFIGSHKGETVEELTASVDHFIYVLPYLLPHWLYFQINTLLMVMAWLSQR